MARNQMPLHVKNNNRSPVLFLHAMVYKIFYKYRYKARRSRVWKLANKRNF